MSDITREDLLRRIHLSRKPGPLDPDAETQYRIEAMIFALKPEERRSSRVVGDGERVRKFLRQFDVMSDLRRA